MKIVDFAKFYNNIKIDDYIEKDVSSVYHYTSPNGLSGIINNTDRFYLNDKTEGIYVLNLCIENIDRFDFLDNRFRRVLQKKCEDRIEQPQRDSFYVYQCCFSTDKDSLCLWNYYTKSEGIKGYNIKINVDELASKITPTPYKEDKIPKLRYGKVIYDKEKQLKILYEIVKLFFDYNKKDTISGEYFVCEYLVDKIMNLGVFFKMDCFKVENEFRLVFDLFLNEDNTYAVIKDKQEFYEKNGVFIPYVDIPFNKELLTGICISPTLDYVATKESILRMTGSNYKNINVKTIYESEIPVRY